MVTHWGSFWVGVVAAPLSVLLAAAVLALTLRALDKNLGLSGCHVCDRGFSCEIGEYTRVGIWVRSRWHNWVIRNQRWHRNKWARNRWNPYRLPGYPIDDGTAAIRRPKPRLVARVWWAIVA